MIPLYFTLLLLLGIYKTKNQSKSNYLNLSRSLTLPSFVATIVTTWYGGILEIGRFSYNYGLVTWIIFGFYYYIAAAIYGFIIGPKLYKNNIKSIPEYFNINYGDFSSKIAAIIILLITSPAPYILIFSTIITHIYEFDIHLAAMIGIIMSISYVLVGGFKSIINTDKFQFIIMYAGFLIAFIYLNKNFGGIEFIKTNVTQNHLSLRGDFSLGFILSWSLIAMTTFIDPNIFKRVYSTNNESIIKKGFIISLLFWFIFDFLTISIGIYAYAIIDSNSINGSPYLILVDKVFPPFYKNFFYISLLSVVMSTIDSFSFASAETIKNNFLNKSINYKKAIWIGLIITAFSSYILVINFSNVIDIWYMSGSIGASVLLIPFLNSLFFKYKCHYPVFLMLFPLSISVIWLFYNNPYNIDALYPGIFSSLFIFYLTLDKS